MLLARLFHLLLTGAAFALVTVLDLRVPRILPNLPVVFWGGVGLLVAGLGLAVWARLHLGRYWSGTITLKEGHRLIRSGPYAMVRHPIYTGIITAMVGTAITVGTVSGTLGVLLLLAAYLLKIRREERFLACEFGEEYARYRKDVNSLFPLPTAKSLNAALQVCTP